MAPYEGDVSEAVAASPGRCRARPGRPRRRRGAPGTKLRVVRAALLTVLRREERAGGCFFIRKRIICIIVANPPLPQGKIMKFSDPVFVKSHPSSRRERLGQLRLEKLVRRDQFSMFPDSWFQFFAFFRLETSIFGPKLGCKLFGALFDHGRPWPKIEVPRGPRLIFGPVGPGAAQGESNPCMSPCPVS